MQTIKVIMLPSRTQSIGFAFFSFLIKSVKPAKNLKEKRETKEDFFKMIDKKGKYLSVGQRSILKRDAAKGIDKINKKYGKAKGGRI